MALTNGPNLGVLVDGGIGEVHYDALMKQWRAMDALTQANIISASITTPPSTPSDGDLYIVPTGSTGVWSGNTNKLARYSSKTSSWEYYTPKNGWTVYNKALSTFFKFNGTVWEEISSEWSAATVDQAEAEAGTATTRRAWTAQRVRQAIAAWWNSVKGALVGPVGIDGNLEIIGNARRIRGDFSSSAVSDRTILQSSVLNGDTGVCAIPNGSSAISFFEALNSSEPTNSSYGRLQVGATEVRLIAGVRGSGSYLPLTTYAGGLKNTEQPITGGLLVTAPGVLGYGPGAGGTVVQSTSKSTNVTLNKPTGRITTHNETLAGGASVNFIIFNSLCSSLDTIVVTVGDNANYIVSCVNVAGGAFRLRITNITGSALSEAISINFSIIKGAAS